MYKCYSYTVPGTGTRFLNKFVQDVLHYRLRRIDPEHITGLLKHKLRDVYSHTHTDQHTPFDVYAHAALNGWPIRFVSTLRDPYLSWISRTYQNVCREDYPDQYRKRHIRFWRNMIENSTKANFVYVAVDRIEGRREMLQSVARHLDAQYAQSDFDRYLFDWAPVGANEVSPQKKEYLENGTINGEVPTFLDFAVEWVNERLEELP